MQTTSNRKWMFVSLFAMLLVSVAAEAGTIQGEIKFDGKPRKRKPIEMSADAKCADQHKGAVTLEERYVHAENGNLVDVFVYISKGVKDAPKPEGKVVIDQKGCQYTPHVTGVVVGQAIEILNSDPTLHNVNCKPETNKGFNQGMAAGTKLEKAFDKPEMKIPLKCDVHPWMGGLIHVMEHPFFAVSNKDGKYEIKGLPAGDYEVTVLYEMSRYEAAAKTIPVKVGAEETKTVDFTFGPKKAAAAE